MASASGSSSGARRRRNQRRQARDDADSDRPAAGSITDVESHEQLQHLLAVAGDSLVVVCASEPGHTTDGPGFCTPCYMMMNDVFKRVASEPKHHAAMFLHIPDNLALVRSHGVPEVSPGSHAPAVLFFRRGTLLERSSTEDADACYDGEGVEWRKTLKRLLAPPPAVSGAVGAASGAAASAPAASVAVAGVAPVAGPAAALAHVHDVPPRVGDAYAIHGIVANHKICALKELLQTGTITFEQFLAGLATIQ
jgi:hypothetical protein